MREYRLKDSDGGNLTKENFDRMIQITDSIKIGKMDTTIIKKPSEKIGVPFDLKHYLDKK